MSHIDHQSRHSHPIVTCDKILIGILFRGFCKKKPCQLLHCDIVICTNVVINFRTINAPHTRVDCAKFG